MRGFTLVEILVSVVILGFLFAAIYGVLNVGNIVFREDISLVGLQQQVRQGMESMVKEIRESTQNQSLCPSGISRSDGNTKITFYVVPQVYGGSCDGPISYSRDVDDANNDGVIDQVIREDPSGTRKILANDITTLNFPPNSNIVEIQLAAKAPKEIAGKRQICFPAPCQDPPKTFKEKVTLRN